MYGSREGITEPQDRKYWSSLLTCHLFQFSCVKHRMASSHVSAHDPAFPFLRAAGLSAVSAHFCHLIHRCEQRRLTFSKHLSACTSVYKGSNSLSRSVCKAEEAVFIVIGEVPALRIVIIYNILHSLRAYITLPRIDHFRTLLCLKIRIFLHLTGCESIHEADHPSAGMGGYLTWDFPALFIYDPGVIQFQRLDVELHQLGAVHICHTACPDFSACVIITEDITLFL